MFCFLFSFFLDVEKWLEQRLTSWEEAQPIVQTLQKMGVTTVENFGRLGQVYGASSDDWQAAFKRLEQQGLVCNNFGVLQSFQDAFYEAAQLFKREKIDYVQKSMERLISESGLCLEELPSLKFLVFLASPEGIKKGLVTSLSVLQNRQEEKDGKKPIVETKDALLGRMSLWALGFYMVLGIPVNTWVLHRGEVAAIIRVGNTVKQAVDGEAKVRKELLQQYNDEVASLSPAAAIITSLSKIYIQLAPAIWRQALYKDDSKRKAVDDYGVDKRPRRYGGSYGCSRRGTSDCGSVSFDSRGMYDSGSDVVSGDLDGCSPEHSCKDEVGSSFSPIYGRDQSDCSLHDGIDSDYGCRSYDSDDTYLADGRRDRYFVGAVVFYLFPTFLFFFVFVLRRLILERIAIIILRAYLRYYCFLRFSRMPLDVLH